MRMTFRAPYRCSGSGLRFSAFSLGHDSLHKKRHSGLAGYIRLHGIKREAFNPLILVSVLGLTCLCGASAPVSISNLVRDPGFEMAFAGVPGCWTVPAGSTSIWCIPPHDGSRALFIPAREDETNWVEQRINGARAGASYLFSCWVKRTVVDEGNYPIFQVLGSEVAANDIWARNQWRQFVLVIPRAGDDSCVRISVPAATEGGYCIDDVSLVELEISLESPLDGAVCSRPEFRWLATECDRILTFRLEISRSPRFEAYATGVFSNADPEPYLPPFFLEAGQHFWRVRVLHGRDEVALSETRRLRMSTPWSGREAGLQPTEKTWSSPSFPLGIYTHAEDLSLVRDAQLDTIVLQPTEGSSLLSVLEKCRHHGPKILLPPDLPAAEHGMLSQIVTRYAPCLAGWYLADEPEGHQAAPVDLMKRREQLRGMIHTLPAAIAILRPWRVSDYAAAADIVMVDPYPIPFFSLTLLSQCVRRAIAEAGPEKQVWAVVQAFDWSHAYNGPDTTIIGRPPTEDEVRALAYLALAEGAHGIFFYDLELARKCGLWEGIKHVTSDLRRDLPLFEKGYRVELPLASQCEGDGAVGPAVQVAIWRLDRNANDRWAAGLYAILVNTTARAVSVTLPSLKTLEDQSRTLPLSPFQVKIVRVQETISPPALRAHDPSVIPAKEE